ncbi:MAG: hypothetical protein AAF296_14135 [Pseudomonadota bacterium]
MLKRMGQAFATVATLLLATIANAECKKLTESQMIELAIDVAFQEQLGFTSTLDRDGQRVFLRYELYPDRSAFVAANSNCCEIATREIRIKVLPSSIADKLNYHGSVRVIANLMPLGDLPDVHDPAHLLSWTKFYHFDNCGNRIEVH